MRTWDEVESVKRMVEDRLEEISEVPGAMERVGERFGYLCTVADTLSWILEEVPTEDFMEAEHLGLGEVDTLIRKDPAEQQSGAQELASLKMPIEEMIHFMAGSVDTIDRMQQMFPRLEQLRIVSHGQKQRQALVDIIAKMKEVRKEMARLESQQSRLGKQMDEIRHQTRLEVAMAQDDLGKRKYTNEDMRSAALQVELASNPKYRELDESAYNISKRRNMLVTEYENLVQTRDIIAVLGVSE